MSVRVKFDLAGLRKLGERVAGMRERAADLSPVLKRQATALDGVIQGAFAGSRSPNGSAWKPLADATIKRRRRGSSKPLADTGQLRSAIAVKGEKRSVTFGVSGAPATYGPTHQFGRGAIPRRPFLPLDEDGDGDFSAGDAKTWKERTFARVAAYVVHGKLDGGGP